MQPRKCRQGLIFGQFLENSHGTVHVAGAELDPAQRQIVDERPATAARLDRRPRAAQV
jgi:hypothetical protein